MEGEGSAYQLYVGIDIACAMRKRDPLGLGLCCLARVLVDQAAQDIAPTYRAVG